MKQVYLAISLFLLTSFAAIAQIKGSLEVSSYRGKNTNYISEGSKVYVYVNGKKYKGNFKVLSDKAILINSDTIVVSQIQELFAKTSSSQLGGLALAIPGTIIGGLGIAVIGTGIAEGGYVLVGAIMITPIAGIAIYAAIKGVQRLSRGKKYSSAKWKYTITSLSPKLN